MNEVKVEVNTADGTLSYPVWWKTGGGGMIRRDCLEYDHPEHTYNFLKRNGIRPEDYGLENPFVAMKREEFDGRSRDDLILEIINLRKELTAELSR